MDAKKIFELHKICKYGKKCGCNISCTITENCFPYFCYFGTKLVGFRIFTSFSRGSSLLTRILHQFLQQIKQKYSLDEQDIILLQDLTHFYYYLAWRLTAIKKFCIQNCDHFCSCFPLKTHINLLLCKDQFAYKLVMEDNSDNNKRTRAGHLIYVLA